MCEFADYKAHALKVRHLSKPVTPDGEDRFQIGMVDDVIVCSCSGSMADICDRLFAYVDNLNG